MEESFFFHVHHSPRSLLFLSSPVIPVGAMMLCNIQSGLTDRDAGLPNWFQVFRSHMVFG